VSALYLVLFLVAAARLAELALAARNTRRLLSAGAVEHGRGHYPLFFLLHGGWLVAMATMIPADTPVRWPWLTVFVLLQGLRVWIVWTLGPYWTTRIINVPGAPLVRRGPYRYLRHPNYLVVVAEVATLPLAFVAWQIAGIFTVLNLALLAWRIRIENRALAPRLAPGQCPSKAHWANTR